MTFFSSGWLSGLSLVAVRFLLLHSPAMRLDSESWAASRRSEFSSRRGWLALLGGYFLLQLAIRTLLSSSADLDESDQLILTQKLSWGYGPQPPLYTWIQIAFFDCFGLSIFSLSLFKNLLLFCTYLLTYFNAQRITRSALCGAAAAASLFFIPQIAWESQRDLTHSVLSATLAAATLACFLVVHQRQQTRRFVLFGVCAGLGLLSKYNYVFWLLGLLLAAASMPKLRPLMRQKRMWVALAIALLMFLPNGLWILGNRKLAFLTASKFGLQESSSWFNAIRVGTTKLAVAVASFLGPLALVYWMIFRRSSSPVAGPGADSANGAALVPPIPSPAPELYQRLLLRTLLVIAGVLVVLVLGFRATDLRERWLQPILVCAPVLAITLVRNRVDRPRFGRLAALALVIMMAVAVIMPGRIVLAERLGREEPLNHPYRRLAVQMNAEIGASDFVVTDTRLVAGNLRLAYPRKFFVSPELFELFIPKGVRGGKCLVLWDATHRTEPPRFLRQWAESRAQGGLDLTQASYFSVTYQYHRKRQMRVGSARFQAP